MRASWAAGAGRSESPIQAPVARLEGPGVREIAREPRRGVPHSVSPAVARRVRRRFSVSKLPPISRPLETGFISLKSCDAGGASFVTSAPRWSRTSAEPGSEGGEVAAGGNDPQFLIRVPLGTQRFGAVLVGEGDV